jgi:integrase
MAHIRKHPKTGKHQVRWRDPATGKEHNRSFIRATDARVFKRKIEASIDQDNYIDSGSGKTRFGLCAENWFSNKLHLRPASWARDEAYLRNHVLPAFGDLAVGQIRKAHVQKWVQDLRAKDLAPATIKECFRIAKSVFEEAVDQRLIVESPCRKVSLPRIEHREQLYLEPVEVERLVEYTAPLFKPLIYSAVYLGCRWGELVGLKRENLNLLKRQVRIVGTLEEVQGQPRYVEETKTRASRRTLSIPPFLCDLLGEHLGSVRHEEFVFVGENGGLLRRSNFRRRNWQPAVKGAQLRIGLRFHDLRHTCASILISQGAHPKEIQARLGHSSITTTMDRYGHLFPSLGAQLDTNLEEVFRQANKSA